MKKLLYLTMLGAMAFTSCKKEKSCECVTTSSPTQEVVINPITTNKIIEDGDCSDLEGVEQKFNTTETTKCKEK